MTCVTLKGRRQDENEATKEQDGSTAWDARAQTKPRRRKVLSSWMIDRFSTMTANQGDGVVLVLKTPLKEQLTSCFGTL